MKRIFKSIAIMIVFLCVSCSDEPVTKDKELAMLIDQSDPLRVKPDADEIISQFGLKKDIWQGVRVTLSYVSDKDVNKTKVIILEKASRLSGNTQIRNALVEHFKKELRSALTSTQTEGTLDHSIIYRTIVKQLNMLSVSGAKSTYLLVYSDLRENSDISFYTSATIALLHKHPETIRGKLEKSAVLNKLSGVQVWLIYEPSSFDDNNTYMAIAHIYKQMFEAKGATVHVENSLNF